MVPGGDLYPTLIRKNPIKPIKIFLQDGSDDLDNAHGSWFLANQQMLSALNYANTHGGREESAGSALRGQARMGRRRALGCARRRAAARHAALDLE